MGRENPTMETRHAIKAKAKLLKKLSHLLCFWLSVPSSSSSFLETDRQRERVLAEIFGVTTSFFGFFLLFFSFPILVIKILKHG